MTIQDVFAPSNAWSRSSLKTLFVLQGVAAIAIWELAAPALLPKPHEISLAFGSLAGEGLAEALYKSLILYIQVLFTSTIFSLLISYGASILFLKPGALFWQKLRFLGTVGMPFLFTIFIGSEHIRKIAMLTFLISTFTVKSMVDIIEEIPKEKYDLARTLRMNNWQIVWEVEVLGRIDFMIDAVRQNSAMGWAMLPMVEALFRGEGGIGVTLADMDKHFNLASIGAIQLLVVAVGVSQDYIIGVYKNIVCPYASLLLERK